MLEAHIRPAYQRLMVDPVARLLVRLPCSANIYTLFSGLIGLAVPVSLVLVSPWLAVILLLISGYLDTLDGTIARLGETSSPFGTVLDIAVDRLVEFAVIFGIFLVDPQGRGILAMLMVGSVLICITTFLVVAIFAENDSQKGFNYGSALMERAEAFVFFIAMVLLPALFFPLALAFIFLVTLTAVIRVVQFYTYCQRKP